MSKTKNEGLSMISLMSLFLANEVVLKNLIKRQVCYLIYNVNIFQKFQMKFPYLDTIVIDL